MFDNHELKNKLYKVRHDMHNNKHYRLFLPPCSPPTTHAWFDFGAKCLHYTPNEYMMMYAISQCDIHVTYTKKKS